MSEPTNRSPALGEPSEAGGGQTVERLRGGDADEVRRELDELTPQAETMPTPDELGGTGGQQAGGAG